MALPGAFVGVVDEEIEPFEVHDIRRLVRAASVRRNGARRSPHRAAVVLLLGVPPRLAEQW